MPSERFDVLQGQLEALRKHMLPESFDETGQYEAQEKTETLALGYRVLAHAEIEAYFEDRSLESAMAARSAWENKLHTSRTVLCLLAFSGKEMPLPPATLEAPSDNKRKAWPALVDIGERLIPSITQFYNYVRNENHGIKEKNLLALLLPIGVDHSAIDPTFLAAIDSFGSLRGIAAHTSSRNTVRQALDPAEELKRVEQLMIGIAVIDAQIDDLIAAINSD